jgi:hypothetical protein
MLAQFVKKTKESRDVILAEVIPDLMKGVLPSNCAVINQLTYQEGNLKKPEKETVLKLKTGEMIAHYHSSIDKWVLNKDISPDILPSIASKETISNEQFNYMSIIAQYKNYCNPGYTINSSPASIFLEDSDFSNFNDDIFIEDDMNEMLKKSASTAHRKLPAIVKDFLSKYEDKIEPSEINKFIRTKGTYAKENVRNNTFKISTEDVMTLIYKNIRRIPELENKNIDKQQNIMNSNNISSPNFVDDAR